MFENCSIPAFWIWRLKYAVTLRDLKKKGTLLFN